MKKAVIIIPTYNERENVARVTSALSEVFKKIKNWKMEVLIVDDTSPDKTYEVVKDLQKKCKWLHLLINKQKAGLGAAYLKGMAKSFGDLKADLVFEFDADLSHDPKKIPQFLKKIDQGYDMVIGSRYRRGGSIPSDWGIDRKFLSVAGNMFLMIVLTDFRIRDWTSGYRAISKKVYDAIHPELHSERFSGYTFQIGFLHKAVRKNFKIAKVPYHFIDRTIGESKIGAEYIKNNLMYVLKIRFQEIIANRVFKFAFVGALGTVVQLLTLTLLRAILPTFRWLFVTTFLVATLFSIEAAIISNFVLNNVWTFADRKLHSSQIPQKFIEFNIASSGSIIIQMIVNFLGETFIGADHLLAVIPVVNFVVDTGLLFAMTGIIIGLFWNFFAYNTFIWKKKS